MVVDERLDFLSLYWIRAMRNGILHVISGLKTSQKHRIKTSTVNGAQTSAYQEISTTNFIHPISAIS